MSEHDDLNKNSLEQASGSNDNKRTTDTKGIVLSAAVLRVLPGK